MSMNIAFAVVSKEGTLISTGGRLHIYWYKTVARKEADKCNGRVIDVSITELVNDRIFSTNQNIEDK